jgi:hypothetical protein
MYRGLLTGLRNEVAPNPETMLLDLAAGIERIYQRSLTVCEWGKQYLRDWLGPTPQDYILFENGDIVPICMVRESVHDKTALLFSQKENRIRSLHSATEEETFKRLPWISITYSGQHTTTDLTDWISEIKCTSVGTPTLKQIIHLGFLVQNEYLEERNATITVLGRMADEERYEYSGSVELKKI